MQPVGRSDCSNMVNPWLNFAAPQNQRKMQIANWLRPCCVFAILLALIWPELVVALKDVSVTIPQAVKRGNNALFICNYDMENDTLYSVKWYKGRREFYRYTPKENPAMKVFTTALGINVERNLSNQSHVVLLAVPLNISGKFTCEISVDAPSFQTAVVSGEMEVVELPEQQASVTGIQPRYRIGDLVDGNCSIKFSKPAANLTWTINSIVVPLHHIKTYQIEKYEDNNLESVISVVHFMVTTQHFLKGQMRLKCTANIFDIFKEEIESIIEEDKPRIMASGRSYDMNNYPYEQHASGDGYDDHSESYLTYYSAADTTSAAISIDQNFLLLRIQRRAIQILRALSSAIESNVNTFTGSTLQLTGKRSMQQRMLTAQIDSTLTQHTAGRGQFPHPHHGATATPVLGSCISSTAIAAIILMTRQQKRRGQRMKCRKSATIAVNAVNTMEAAQMPFSQDVQHFSNDTAQMSKATKSSNLCWRSGSAISTCSKSFYNCHATFAHFEVATDLEAAAIVAVKAQRSCASFPPGARNQKPVGNADYQQLSGTLAGSQSDSSRRFCSNCTAAARQRTLLQHPKQASVVPKDQTLLMTGEQPHC